MTELETLFVEVDPDLIDMPVKGNGRLQVDDRSIRELADSIQRHGLLCPIVLRAVGPRFELVAGGRRLAAWRRVRSKPIPARVFADDFQHAGEVRLLENTARADLSPFEEAVQLAALFDAESRDVDALAQLCGRSRDWVEGRLRMLDWSDELLAAVHERKVSLGAADRLSQICPPETQAFYVVQAREHGINVRTAADWLSQSRLALPAAAEDVVAGPITDGPQFETVVKARCGLCANMVPLELTSSVRVCQACVHGMKDVCVERQKELQPGVSAPDSRQN